MGVDIGEIVLKERVILEQLKGYSVAIDGFNTLYQFLASIRQPDGTPLMDLSGRVTSHLSGLFYRTIRLLEVGIKPMYVFDGKPPAIKSRELEERRRRKEAAAAEARELEAEGEVEKAKIKKKQTLRLTDEMIAEAKQLLDAMGIPYTVAPEEGEAEAAYLAKRGRVRASASQDYDSLLFGSPLLIRNLSISGRRKLPGKDIYTEIQPERIELKQTLEFLGINREQLVVVGLLVGTDYNDGVKGIGPKKALKLVKEIPVEKILKNYGLPEDVFHYFLNPPVEDFEPRWREPDREAVIRLLVHEHDFSEERVRRALERMHRARGHLSESPLDSWL